MVLIDNPNDIVWWYVAEEDKPRGPVQFATVARRLLEGDLSAETLVWCTAFPDWRRVEDVPLFQTFLHGDRTSGTMGDDIPNPPPIPDKPAGETKDETEPEDSEVTKTGSRIGRERIVDLLEEHVWLAAAAICIGAALLVGGLIFLTRDGSAGASGSNEAAGPMDPLTAVQDSVAKAHFRRLRSVTTGDTGAEGYGAPVRDLAFQRRIGFRRLPRLADTTVVRFVNLWSEVLSRATESECEALATWSASNQVIWRAVAKLPAERLARLLEILDHAVLADAERSKPLEPALREESFQRLQEQLSPERLDTLGAYLQANPQTPAQACWTDRTLYRTVPRLPHPHDHRMARALMRPTSR